MNTVRQLSKLINTYLNQEHRKNDFLPSLADILCIW